MARQPSKLFFTSRAAGGPSAEKQPANVCLPSCARAGDGRGCTSSVAEGKRRESLGGTGSVGVAFRAGRDDCACSLDGCCRGCCSLDGCCRGCCSLDGCCRGCFRLSLALSAGRNCSVGVDLSFGSFVDDDRGMWRVTSECEVPVAPGLDCNAALRLEAEDYMSVEYKRKWRKKNELCK
jgi:hypothetical protein